MRIKTKKRWMLAFTCFSVAAISACFIPSGREIGESTAVQFHNQFNRERYREIYRQTNDIFKNSVSEDDFAVWLKIVRLRIGAVKQSNLSSWQVKDTPAGKIISLQFKTEFTEEDAVEDFVFAVSGDKAVLQGYKISSPLLDRNERIATPLPNRNMDNKINQRPAVAYAQIALGSLAAGLWSLFLRPAGIDPYWSAAIMMGTIRFVCALLLLS